MKKYVLPVLLGVAVLMMAQGCEQLTELSKDLATANNAYSWWQVLQLSYAPKNLLFTKKDIEAGKERGVYVWNRFPFVTELNFTVEPADDWVVVEPTEGSSTGPWDREYISVKLDDSILGSVSNTSPLTSSIAIKTSNGLERQVKIRVVDNLQGVGNAIRDMILERIRAWLGNIFRWNNPGNGNGTGGSGNNNTGSGNTNGQGPHVPHFPWNNNGARS